ncbi:(deoxy)nucleoside triphosphate pyrophosphohydrolase [Flammeovirga agarivorans]|uniref:8-oxo-dGTP diphosphatase n=1 Tax=Flammeovirga agarivorans TaxID=2726742 RepID=A0A7X8SLY9_9BACT|nr:(deoxy)nucleoside triphosphate pyrophosphohydrolase [Flammeovirga agarivorans]NLR92668.1 (deoxy)nucleoside triphosphate pyrophosphohydrolase [Flammeovirga agarivorans]
MIQVVAGIIIENKTVFIAKRKKGNVLEGYWEFPGGKHEIGETLEASLIREFEEEFNVEIEVLEKLHDNIHHYPQISIHLHSFICKKIKGEFQLLDHDEVQWVNIEELENILLAPADIPIIEALKKATLNK